jgi:hypothetical protein
MKNTRTSMVWTLLLLLLAYGSGWSELCAPCNKTAPTMSCHMPQADDAAFAEACCCGEMVCGEAEERAPALPMVELATEMSSAPVLVALPFVPRRLAVAPVVVLENANQSPPLFQLYCSLLI